MASSNKSQDSEDDMAIPFTGQLVDPRANNWALQQQDDQNRAMSSTMGVVSCTGTSDTGAQSGAMANIGTFSIVTGAPGTSDRLQISKNTIQNTIQISNGASLAGTLDSETLKLKLKEAKRIFVQTKTFEDIKTSLERNYHVTICGASGEGKTTMALMLGRKYKKQGFRLVFVDRTDVFEFGSCLNTGQKICLIFDDIFGSLGGSTDFTHVQRLCDSLKLHIDTHLQSRQMEKSLTGEACSRDVDNKMVANEKKNFETKEKKDFETKEIRVIFTSKSYNFNKMQYQRIAFFRGKTVVDLNSKSESTYSDQEKLEMFLKHKNVHPKVKLGDLDIKEVIKQDPSLFGFPVTCKLFFEFSSFTEKANDFFKHPLHYLRIELDKILNQGNDQAAALILIFLCGGSIKLPELEISNTNKKVDEMIMHVTNFNSATRSGIASAVRSFRGTFLSKGDHPSFAHDSIFESCACALYQMNPGFVLQFCSLDFLFQKVKLSYNDEANVSERLNYLLVSEVYFPLVISRLMTSMKKGIFSKTVAHPLTEKKSFVRMFLKEMGTQAIENRDWIEGKENGKCFLYWVVKSKSIDLVQNIEKSLDIKFQNQAITEALFASVESESLDLLKYLISKLEAECDQNTLNELLIASAKSSSKDMVKYLLDMGSNVSAADSKKRNFLHHLCIEDNSLVLKLVMNHATKIDLTSAINAVNEEGRTPLMLAALSGSWDCFQLLKVEEQAAVCDHHGNGLIHLACIGGNKKIVGEANTPVNLNSRGYHGRTPIMLAALNAKSDVFDLLLSHKADVTLVDEDGDTLLHFACIGGSTHIVERLVTSSNLNIRDFHGRTPIMEAALNAKSDVFDLLLSHKADVTLVDEDGDTLLHYACFGGSTHIVERLVTSSNLNIRSFHGRTPIMEAALNAKSDVFDLLLSHKADVTLVDEDGHTLLHYACIGGSTHIVERLVTSSNLNIRGFHGRTPIMEAALNAKSDVFDLLLSHKADVTLVDEDGDTLLHHACIGGSTHIVERLVTSSNLNIRDFHGTTPIVLAARYAKSDVFDLLLSHNADVTLVDEDGDTLLHFACIGGSTHIVERLVTSSNLNIRSFHGRTPIMLAARYAKSDVFDLLLSHNADVTLVDEDGDTLLHHACFGGSRHIVERLASRSNVNLRDLKGRTAIMLAGWKGHGNIVDLLRENGADTTYVDSEGRGDVGGNKSANEKDENINSHQGGCCII